MGFKQWLFSEDAGASSANDDFFYGLQLYPTDAFDYVYSTSYPAEHQMLQNRWKIETKQGRKMININYGDFSKRNYTAVVSSNAPGTESGFWKHKPDNPNEGALKPVSYPHLYNIAWGKDAAHPGGKLEKSNPSVSFDLDKIFGDKGTGKVPTLKKDFDKPWTRVFENITPYDVIGPGRGDINANMGPGIRSKYVCSDDVNPYDEKMPKQKIANFGFNRRGMKKKQKKV